MPPPSAPKISTEKKGEAKIRSGAFIRKLKLRYLDQAVQIRNLSVK